MKPSARQYARQAFAIEAEAVARQLELLDWQAMDRAVLLLASAQRIATSGCGHSGIACRHFAHLLCCIERPARFLSPSEAVHGGMGFLRRGDVLVLVSRGGKTGELLPMLDIAAAKGAPVIVLTENISSPLAQGASVVIPMTVERECDRFNSQGTASFAVQNAVFDALQVALLEETGFTNNQFGLIHPGGAVGERINRK